MEDKDGDVAANEALLVPDSVVEGDKYFESGSFGAGKQVSILPTRQSLFRHG